MKIVCDENMPAVEALFSNYGEIHRVPGRSMSADDLNGADLLLVRSVTKVTESMLSKATSLKMVGTATIGMDHIDQDYLAKRSIPFFSAPGCNADAVVDYDLSAIHQILHEQGRNIDELTVGIIGVGNVGSRLEKRLRGLGVSLLLNDPPKAKINPEPYVALETVLEQADIICCHTPLVREGKSPSYHLINEQNLKRIKPNAILLNAGRGAVIDNLALKDHLSKPDNSLSVILDVWAHEPEVDADLAQYVSIATPHIAGYSLEGKLRGTFMLYQAFCQVFGHREAYSLEEILPKPALSSVVITPETTVEDVMRWVYDPYRDDRALRQTLNSEHQSKMFDQLRKNYPVRREFSSLEVRGNLSSIQTEKLSSLGFKLI